MIPKGLLPVEFVREKQAGRTHSRDDIYQFMTGLVNGHVSREQAAAWLMAVYFRGLSTEETQFLTEVMAQSGEMVHFPFPTVDKHSTGGVGDKPSLIIAPAVAAAGCFVPMMSGRGLGHTGGTADKLESIPGFNPSLSLKNFRSLVEKVGCALITQTPTIAPADRILYGLRDVTSTVENIGLITASILSKKKAEGTHYLVMDVKYGNGAFMKTKPDAEKLASSIEQTAKLLGIETRSFPTDMNQPLGQFAGNACEVRECIYLLQGKPADSRLAEISRLLGSHMISLQLKIDIKSAESKYDQSIQSGKALEKFREIIEAQGGEPKVCDNPDYFLPLAKPLEVVAPHSGQISEMDTYRLGMMIVAMGGGRQIPSDKIDPTVGFQIHVHTDDHVKKGDRLFTLFHPNASDFSDWANSALKIKRS